MFDRRLVARLLHPAGLRMIVGRASEAQGCPAVLAWGDWKMGTLERVEERYAIYRETVPAPSEDDGA